VPGLLATLAAAAEQEYQRAAGAWHSEWQPYADLLRLTGSAASWGVELLAGLTGRALTDHGIAQVQCPYLARLC
jgi:hypothetical protein